MARFIWNSEKGKAIPENDYASTPLDNQAPPPFGTSKAEMETYAALHDIDISHAKNNDERRAILQEEVLNRSDL